MGRLIMNTSVSACVALILLFPANTRAQCCTAGNPVNTNCNLDGGGAGLLNVGYSFMRSQSDTYYQGTRALDKTYLTSGFDFSMLSLSYGVSKTLRITADVGYFFDKSQTFVGSGYTRSAHGISDGTLGLTYKTYASDDGLFDVTQSAKVTIPIGDFEQAYDGIILPIDFQPSSGNYRYNLGLLLSKRFVGSDFSLLSFSSLEMSQAIRTSNTYHRYGNLYTLSLSGAYRVSAWLAAMLQLRMEMRERALTGTIDQLPPAQTRNNQYSYINASGGVLAYIAPQITASLFNGWSVSLQYNLPVYRNVYGEEQLTNRSSMMASISRSFNLLGRAQDILSPETKEHLSHMDIRVRGNCDMCKERIEGTASTVSGVVSSEWNPDTKLLAVYYDDAKPDTDAIEMALAKVGHDTDHHTAPTDVYESLPACCLYRDK
jgi:hypothetical protein